MHGVEDLIRRQDWVCVEGGKDWRDGLLLGNGNLAAVASTPGPLEWVLNKVDVFDPTSPKELLDKITPHERFLKLIRNRKPKNTLFLGELENATFKGKRMKDTMSACLLRMSSWHGIGWSAPPMPRTERRLSLYDAVLEEQMDSHNLHLTVRSFIPRGREVLCMRISGQSGNQVPHILEMIRPIDSRLTPPCWHQDASGILGFSQTLPGKGACYAVAAAFVPRGTSPVAMVTEAEALTGVLEYNGDCDLFVAVKRARSGSDAWNDALAEIASAREPGFDALEKAHRKWWHAHWQNSAYADFGREKEIQRAYTFSLYELACVYGTAPVPGLNGLAYGPLNERTPGVGCQGYAHDQNVQISALALIPSNNLELFSAYADTYLAMLPRLKKYTKRIFGCDGAYLPLCTNQLGVEYATRAYRYTMCGAAYTGMVLCYAWQYTRDVTLLREKLYPLLREFVIFYTNVMRLGKDGCYHLDWSVPPEIFTLTRDELSTISLLKLCLQTVIEGAKLLGKDAKLLPKWEDVLAHFPPFPKRPDGAYWCGPDVPLNHFFYGGHTLYPFFPAVCDDDRAAAQKTLDFIEKTSVERTFADHNGQFHMNHDWSVFIITAANLRVGNYSKGWRLFRRFLELFGKENGLFSHDPIIIGSVKESEANERRYGANMLDGQVNPLGKPLEKDDPNISHVSCVTENPDAKRMAPSVIEGNSAFVFLASEILLQSYGGELRLFPGVPEKYTGSFVNFLARGGFVVDASMESGRITHVKIRAPHGGTFRLPHLKGRRITLKPGEVFEM